MTTKVKNRKGSADEKCSVCGAWIVHWENGTGKKRPAICGASHCSNSPVEGGHVIRADAADKASHITPICSECNKKGADEEYTVHWDLYPSGDKTKCK